MRVHVRRKDEAKDRRYEVDQAREESGDLVLYVGNVAIGRFAVDSLASWGIDDDSGGSG